MIKVFNISGIANEKIFKYETTLTEHLFRIDFLLLIKNEQYIFKVTASTPVIIVFLKLHFNIFM